MQGSAQTCKVRGGGAGMQLGTGENRVGDLMPYACGQGDFKTPVLLLCEPGFHDNGVLVC